MLDILRLPQRVPPAIDVSEPRGWGRGRGWRVAARVEGREVWFESDDTSLMPSAEAFGAALLVPSLAAGRPLRLAAPACDLWAQNLASLTNEFRRLWYPEAPRPIVVPAPIPSLRAARSAGTALCFSGGVDAFYTLLRGGHAIDRLVYAGGYDVPLRDRRRTADVISRLRAVAAETGSASSVIRTNLRRHSVVKRTPWLRVFGGGLAAVGHLLGREIGRLLISSDGLGFEHPDIGSRSSTDHLHSSASLGVEHVAATVTRLEKIRSLAGEPLVQRHLRVCWKNVGTHLNCGRCEKCLRTMLALEACGMLGHFGSFRYGQGLTAAIDSLPAVNDVVEPFYRDLQGHGMTPSLTAAVGRLLDRTPSRRRPPPVAGPPRQTCRHRLLDPARFASVCDPLVGQRVGYVRPAGNVGDQLIELAMIQLFAEYGIRWRRWRPDVAGDSAGLDLLVFGGGGNMGIRYPGNYALRGRAVASGLPVTILPQSFTSAEDRPYTRVFVRERGSLALRPDGIVAPDLALGLATPPCPPPVADLGVFLRRDQERTGRKPLWARDPVRLRRDPLEYLALAGRYRRIVTDRLHFAIAGLHAGRDVTLLPNDYHKNHSLHQTWLAELGCHFADNAAGATQRAA